jgi:hypothetical protein
MLKKACLASAVAVFLLSGPAWALKKPHKLSKLGAGVYLASEFDAATTYYLLQNCGSRCREANPMVRPFAQNPGVFAVLGASAYTVNYLAGRLEDKGHSHWAEAVRLLAIGVHVGAGAHALALEH